MRSKQLGFGWLVQPDLVHWDNYLHLLNKIDQDGTFYNTSIISFFSLRTVCGFTQKIEDIRFSKNRLFAEFNYNPNLDLYSIFYDRMFKSKGLMKIGLQTGLTFSTAVETGHKG